MQGKTKIFPISTLHGYLISKGPSLCEIKVPRFVPLRLIHVQTLIGHNRVLICLKIRHRKVSMVDNFCRVSTIRLRMIDMMGDLTRDCMCGKKLTSLTGQWVDLQRSSLGCSYAGKCIAPGKQNIWFIYTAHFEMEMLHLMLLRCKTESFFHPPYGLSKLQKSLTLGI